MERWGIFAPISPISLVGGRNLTFPGTFLTIILNCEASLKETVVGLRRKLGVRRQFFKGYQDFLKSSILHFE
jgi:hypothetical protein